MANGPAVRTRRWRAQLAGVAAVLAVLAFLLLATAAAGSLRRPAPVPDHTSLLAGTAEMRLAGSTTLGQRVRPTRDRLTAVDLLLVAQRASQPGTVRLEVQEWPAGRVVRRSQVPAAALATGSAWQLRPGQPGERWTTFGFEPIEGSAGRDLLLVLSYSDGGGADDRVATLARFPGRYPDGELHVNGTPHDGHLLFRLAGAGTRWQAVGVAAANLARFQPLAPGTLAGPVLLAACCAALAGAIILRLVGRWPAPGEARPAAPTGRQQRSD